MTNRMATIWHTPDELTGHLAISIMKAKSEIKRPGWQRAVNYDEATLRREIMELKSENEQISAELINKQNIIESLTEQTNLSFDSCIIHFDYHYNKTIYSGSRSKSEKVTKSKDVSLVDIFKVISLEMLDVSISESAVENAIKSKLFDENQSVFFDDSQIVKQILMQLSELKLIYSNWSKNRIALFWGLTEYGKKKRNDLLLIRNQQQSNEGE